jgi:hypothetical protein
MTVYQLLRVCIMESDTAVSEESGMGKEEVFLSILR